SKKAIEVHQRQHRPSPPRIVNIIGEPLDQLGCLHNPRPLIARSFIANASISRFAFGWIDNAYPHKLKLKVKIEIYFRTSVFRQRAERNSVLRLTRVRIAS